MKIIKKKSKKTESKILLTEIKQLREKLNRAIADYNNLERRVECEIGNYKKEAFMNLVDKLLSPIDDLERAENHLKDKGLSLAISKLKEVLASEGVKEIHTKDSEFDAQTMDCVDVVDGQKNIVVEELIKGYILNGRIIRPAKVKVGKGKE